MITYSGPLAPTFFGDFAMPGIVTAGWLISRFLRREGFPQSFPGAGAKVVIGWIVFSWIALVAIMLIMWIAQSA